MVGKDGLEFRHLTTCYSKQCFENREKVRKKLLNTRFLLSIRSDSSVSLTVQHDRKELIRFSYRALRK